MLSINNNKLPQYCHSVGISAINSKKLVLLNTDILEEICTDTRTLLELAKQ